MGLLGGVKFLIVGGIALMWSLLEALLFPIGEYVGDVTITYGFLQTTPVGWVVEVTVQ